MNEPSIQSALNDLLEELAALEHERWSHWQRYLHSRGVLQSDGSLLLSAEDVEGWQRQIKTPYEQLTEKERESDREQVRKYLPLIVRRLVSSS